MRDWVAYFDESGDSTKGPVFCVSGLVVRADLIERMEAKWVEQLARLEIPHFHTVDCAHRNRTFEGATAEKCSDAIKTFIGIINSFSAHKTAFVTPPLKNEFSDTGDDSYSFCLRMCAGSMTSFARSHHRSPRLKIYFEAGHKSRPLAERALKELENETDAIEIEWEFVTKRERPLIQSADIVAWLCAKRVKDVAFSDKKPRADYKRLTEFRTEFVNCSWNDQAYAIPHSGIDALGWDVTIYELYNRPFTLESFKIWVAGRTYPPNRYWFKISGKKICWEFPGNRQWHPPKR